MPDFVILASPGSNNVSLSETSEQWYLHLWCLFSIRLFIKECLLNACCVPVGLFSTGNSTEQSMGVFKMGSWFLSLTLWSLPSSPSSLSPLACSSETLCWNFPFLCIFSRLASHHWNLRSQCQLLRKGISDFSIKRKYHTLLHMYDINMFYDLTFSYLLAYTCVYLCTHACVSATNTWRLSTTTLQASSAATLHNNSWINWLSFFILDSNTLKYMRVSRTKSFKNNKAIFVRFCFLIWVHLEYSVTV